MTNEAIDFAFGGDPADVRVPQKETVIIKTPTRESPLVCRLLPDPLRNNSAYYEVDLIKHMIGPDPAKDTRYHLSRRMLNDRAPEVDRYWDCVNGMKELKAAGKEGTDDYRKFEKQKQLFNVNKRFWLLVLPKGETKPKALQVTFGAIKELFGAPARGKDPAYSGIIESMKSKGRSPYNLKSDKGWLKIWREGTGLETKWKVEEAKVEKVVDGEDVTVPLSHPIPESVFTLKKADIVDLGQLDMVEEKIWTIEECQRFVDSFGTVIPDRCKKKNNNNYMPPQQQETVAGGKPAASEATAPWSGSGPQADEAFDMDSIF